MAESDKRLDTEPDSETVYGGAADPTRALRLLGDEDARRIVLAADEAKTVAQLTEELALSESTAYRKIKALAEVGLLERVNPCATGRTPTRYRRPVGTVTVDFVPELRVEYDTHPDM